MAAFSTACNSALTQSSEVSKTDAQNEQIQPKASPTPFVEPIWEFSEYPDSLRKRWQDFTANGQYRLAQPSDMRFSERAKESIATRFGSNSGFQNPIPFTYVWGDLHFNKRPEDDHLAAIIVDTAKTDDNRFSLVIFSPINAKKDVYETNWLYRDRNLSKTTLGGASGYFFIYENFDDGTYKGCSVEWNRKQRKFECK